MSELMTAREVARLFDLEYATFLSRLRKGWYTLKPEPIGRHFMVFKRVEAVRAYNEYHNQQNLEAAKG